jgi:acyl-homoserine-lactone acylase
MLPLFSLAVALTLPASAPDSATEAAIAARVEIIRTEHGVPHIYAEDLEAMGFGLGWVQSEDWGDVAAVNLVKARGEYARWVGHDSIDGDFAAREDYALAVETWPLLEPDTRAVYEGFAAGVRHYARLHPDLFPAWMKPDFTGIDAHAREVQSWSRGDARSFLRAMGRAGRARPGAEDGDAPSLEGAARGEAFALDGSNAWAFGPSRSKSGHAMLLRNPHLAWNAGYYEAQVVVPGVLDFYGDFRIGGAFGIIGGFNRHLGWATTNNYPTYSQVYALEVDPADSVRYVLDGRAHALQERRTTVEYATIDGGLDTETRSTWWTTFGPVIHRTAGRIYVLKDPRAGEWRGGQQFLRMMRTESFDEWLSVMRWRAYPQSNFTYADADGHIAHLYNARLPLLPHASTGDTAALARTSADIWTEYVPFDALPLYLDPPGGYVQQENDTPDYTNLNVPMNRDTMPANLPAPRLRPRSQLALELLHDGPTLSLEDVVALKHTPRMLVAERVVDDLLAAVRASGPDDEVASAADVLERWDRTAAAQSRGGVLFEIWAVRYGQTIDTARFFREPWTPDRPMATPRGIGSPTEAAGAFAWAAERMRERGWAYDIPWGEVHRVIRGDVDEPVSGCPPTLGCFRALSFAAQPDGRLAANRGDGWVLAVEFGDVPRAYSVLAYGESNQPDSPYFDDQAAMFAHGRMKTVAFSREDVERAAIRRYRPGVGAAAGGG